MRFSERNKGRKLTAMRLKILKLLAEGRVYKQIAGELFISIPTVRYHSRIILELLDAKNIAHACWIAAKAGLI